MIEMQAQLLQTPLYNQHLKLKARMVPFAGWMMPVQYTGILSEYQQTRNSASLFDTSHMGEFLIEGDALKGGLDRIVTQRIVDMPFKTCRYGAMLNSQGGIIDDLIVYRVDRDRWMVVVNAADIEKKAEHFLRFLDKNVKFHNASFATGKLDLQGPRSKDVLLNIVKGVERLEYFSFDEFDLLGERVIISRTGYTGELGYEVYYPWNKTQELWDKLLDNNMVKPAGLGARDVLRLEMGYSLYGNDLNETISPLEAGLAPFVDMEKDFFGKDELQKQKNEGAKRRMIYFVAEGRQSPRHGHGIFDDQMRPVGTVTSGTFSPSLKKGIGMGLVERKVDLKGKEFFVGEKEGLIKVQLSQRPFYKDGSLR